METGTLIGSHRVDSKLGEGGMANVYKAWNIGLHRYEALKAPKLHFAHDPTFVGRFLTEARTAAGLQHPHIATIHTVSDVQAAQPYFTMELIEGGDLAALLHQRGRIALAEAIPLLRQIGSALDYAHTRGIIHRDVKPANVLLQSDGRSGWNAKVVDFGIARAQETEDGARLTKTGMIVGTPEYMSPEQGGSGAKVGSQSDQYSLGIIAYEMLCGHPPFTAGQNGSAIAVIMSHISDQPHPPMQHVSGLSFTVNNAILKALAKDPNDRFHSCSEFVDGLIETSIASAVLPQVSQMGTNVNRSTKNNSRIALIVIGLTTLAGIIMMVLGVRNGLPQTSPVVKVSSSIPSLTVGATGNETRESPKSSLVSVPDLVGVKKEQAQALLEIKSLDADIMNSHDATVPAGSVIRQIPAANTKVSTKTTVQFWISTGPLNQPLLPVVQSAVEKGVAVLPPVTIGQSAVSSEDLQQVRNYYTQWLLAWQKRDLSNYLSYYSTQVSVKRAGKPSYGYEELSRKLSMNWARQSYISVRSEVPSITSNNNRIILSAIQNYDSSTYWDEGKKTLVWVKENGTWRIIEEYFDKQSGGAKQ